jgi:hypothetical protein
MANATVTLKVFPFPQGIDNTQRRVKASGQAAISANPNTYPTGGLPMVWTSMVDQLSGAAVQLNTNQTIPIMVYLTSVGGSGYEYNWNKSTNKLQIFTGAAAQAALTELTGGTVIPAAISSDVIEFDAEFARAVL